MDDLRDRRLELTRAALREAVLAASSTRSASSWRISPPSSISFDVAAAAVKLAHEASHDEEGARADEQDIPTPHAPERPSDRGRRRPQDRGPERRPGGGRGARSWDRVRLFIGSGRAAGLRPGDIVGAIANEAGVPGSAIGVIEIADKFSLVEVPAEAADHVIEALRSTKIRGKRVQVRRDGAN